MKPVFDYSALLAYVNGDFETFAIVETTAEDRDDVLFVPHAVASQVLAAIAGDQEAIDVLVELLSFSFVELLARTAEETRRADSDELANLAGTDAAAVATCEAVGGQLITWERGGAYGRAAPKLAVHHLAEPWRGMPERYHTTDEDL